MKKNILSQGVMILTIIFLCCSHGFAASGSLEYIAYNDVKYEKQSDDYSIDLFFGNKKPTKEYEIIGEITGRVRSGDEVRIKLKQQARDQGGDAVIDINASPYYEHVAGHGLLSRAISREANSGIIVKAKLIKYKAH
jgi:hypothetical protein